MITKKHIIITISIFILLSGFAAGQTTNTKTEIFKAANALASTNQAEKQAGLELLNNLGADAVPDLVSAMEANRNEESFLGLEVVNFGATLGVDGLPIIEQGLKDPNSAARQRAARIATTMGSDAATIVNGLAELILDPAEIVSVRSQAIDALRAIGVSTPKVVEALATALTGEAMLIWKVNQTMNTLGITHDDTLAILLDQFVKSKNTHANLAALQRDFRLASDPIGLVEKVLNNYSSNEILALLPVIESLYAIDSVAISDMLFQLVDNGNPQLQEQAIYVLGENSDKDETILPRLVELLDQNEMDSSQYLWVAYALEKMDPANQEVSAIFLHILTEETASPELQLAAARFLESADPAPEQVLALLDQIDQIDEDALWRLSPMVYRSAQSSDLVLAHLEANAESATGLSQEYGISILTALGVEVEPSLALQIVKPAEKVDKVPAFPGAEGYGKYTIGGRGGDVYIVTNLNNDGPGSLREAVEKSGPRTILFAVSGNIMLNQSLDINNPYVTIVGQRAPGAGITIAGAPVNVNTDQVIIRYLRFRLGDYNNFEADSIGGRGISDIILDHISASWATDETVSFYVAENLTLQWSFITESLRGSLHAKGNHGYGGIWGGSASYHHNLMAHHSSRTPRFDGERTLADPALDFRNNVIYNWGFNSVYGGEGAAHNMIGNYYKAGPGTSTGARYRVLDLSNGGKWYIADNFVYGSPSITANNWNGGINYRLDRMEDVRVDVEFPVPEVTTHTAEEAFELVLANAGVTIPYRDEIDQRVAEETRTGTATYGGLVTGLDSGIIDSQDNVGGLVFLRSFSAPLDTDQDGIPDWWAIKYGFAPDGGIDHRGDIDQDGYTNLEEYLNFTNPLKSDW